jgi:hypothetical protein
MKLNFYSGYLVALVACLTICSDTALGVRVGKRNPGVGAADWQPAAARSNGSPDGAGSEGNGLKSFHRAINLTYTIYTIIRTVSPIASFGERDGISV